MKNSSSKTLLVLAALFALAGIGADAFIFSGVRGAEASAAALRSESDSAGMQNARIAYLQAMLQKTADDRAKIDSYLVSKDNEVAFLEEVEKVASEIGAKAKIDSVSEDTFAFATSTVPALRIAMSASGTWMQVALLAEKIRSLPHKIIFTSLNFQTSGDIPLGKNGKPLSGALPQWTASFGFVAAKDK